VELPVYSVIAQKQYLKNKFTQQFCPLNSDGELLLMRINLEDFMEGKI
jgi:hypothetical protein